MNQMDRDKVAVLTVIKHMGGDATFADVSLRAGEGLSSAVLELVRENLLRKEGNRYFLEEQSDAA